MLRDDLKYVKASLELSDQEVANLLGVTLLTLEGWRDATKKWILTEKAHRLVRLAQVVKVIKNIKITYKPKDIINLLVNARIAVEDPDEIEPDDDCAFIGYIQFAPFAGDWLERTREAINDYEVNIVQNPNCYVT